MAPHGKSRGFKRLALLCFALRSRKRDGVPPPTLSLQEEGVEFRKPFAHR
jgi:hypothetical protein